MIVLGIDPGLASTGYGCIDHSENRSRLICCGTITTPARTPLPDRLLTIFQRLTELIEQVNPEAIAVEELFFANNAVSVMGVAQARGVAILAACKPGTSVHEYTPLQVKQAVTGSGRADKTQVHRMVEILLGLHRGGEQDPGQAGTPSTAHESDALAIALCHAQTSRMGALIRDSQTQQLAKAPGGQPRGRGRPRRIR